MTGWLKKKYKCCSDGGFKKKSMNGFLPKAEWQNRGEFWIAGLRCTLKHCTAHRWWVRWMLAAVAAVAREKPGAMFSFFFVNRPHLHTRTSIHKKKTIKPAPPLPFGQACRARNGQAGAHWEGQWAAKKGCSLLVDTVMWERSAGEVLGARDPLHS